MNCPYCGQPNDDGARFCGNCGADLSNIQSAAPAQSSYAPDYAQPAQVDYSQQASYQNQPSYAQQPYDQGYAQPQQASADPYQQQSYQPQYNQGYNAPVQAPKKKFPVLPVVIGVVALVAVIGGFMLFRGNSGGGNSGGGNTGTPTVTGGGNSGGGGNEGGGGTSITLGDTYTDSKYGYSFQAPDGATVQTDADEGIIYLVYSDPDMWVRTYVREGDASVSNWATTLESNYDQSVVEQGSNYVIGVGTDSDGDTNYTLVYVGSGISYLMDIYYHPADEATMRDVAYAIMNTFSI